MTAAIGYGRPYPFIDIPKSDGGTFVITNTMNTRRMWLQYSEYGEVVKNKHIGKLPVVWMKPEIHIEPCR